MNEQEHSEDNEVNLEFKSDVWWYEYNRGNWTMPDDFMMQNLEIMELPETVMCND